MGWPGRRRAGEPIGWPGDKGHIILDGTGQVTLLDGLREEGHVILGKSQAVGAYDILQLSI